MSLIKYTILFIFFTTLAFSYDVILTKQEKEFLEKNPSITLGTDSNWSPYVIKTDANSVIGFDNSILEKVNELTGANFQIITGKWKEIVEKAKNKEIDGLSTSAVHSERKKYFNFSEVYISTFRILIVSSSNPKNISSFNDLDGRTLAIQEGNLFDEKLAKSKNNIIIKKYSSNNALLDALITGEADAMIGNETISYHADKNRLAFTKIVNIIDNSKLDLVFSIRNDWPEALSILNKGLNAIPNEEKVKIRNEWFITNKLIEKKLTQESKLLTFTKQEKDYLSQINELKMCIDPDWMPFEKNENGKHIGMSADYFELIKEKLNVPINIVQTKTWLESLDVGKNRGCDIFSLVMSTPEREKYLNFSIPYLEIPLVLATNTDEIFVNDITKVKNKKMGIVKGYAYGELLRKKYPQLDLIDVDNINDGLEKVQTNELYGFIGSLSTVGYHIQKNYFGQLKIAGKFDDKWKLGIGIRNDIPILTSIFNKAISSISEESHQKILNKWLSVKYERVSNQYLFEAITISLTIIFIILFINRQLSKEVRKREKVEKYLKQIINGAELGTWTWNPKTNKNIINERWAEIIGYTKEDLDDKDHFSLIFEEDRNNIHKALEEHISGKKENYETEFRMKAKDGSTKWIYSNGGIVQRDSAGNVELIAGIHQDITEKKELEEEIKKQEKFIFQQSKQAAMGEMLANIAHQWRQPLSVITTSASGVKIKKELNDLSDKELKEFMDQILKSGKYLSQTIEDFRNFFKKDIEVTNINTNELISKSLQFLQSKLKSREIELIKSIKTDTIYSYENELVQALINIFNNAVDALEKSNDKRYIFIDINKENNETIISVKDNAKGINETIIHKVFDPYFTTKHQSQGTGIGLHMTREIVIKHLKGTIEVSNDTFTHEGKEYIGANFKIRMPSLK